MAFVDFKQFELLSELARSAFGYVLLGGNPTRISAVCPHHEPSEKNSKGHHLHFNDVKGCFFCYVCETSGKMHTGGYTQLVMLNTGMSQQDAFKWLCDRYNIKEKGGVKKGHSVKETRMKFCEESHVSFIEGCKRKDRKFLEAYQYLLNKRGLSPKSMQKFRVGFIPDNTVISKMRNDGFTDEELLKAGILRESNRPGQKYWCPFFRRVTLMAGHNVYGRFVPRDGEEVKGLPHLYTSGANSLFNENSIRPEAQRDVLFVVESIFDAITIQQYIDELNENWAVVATLGTKGIKKEELIEKMKTSGSKEIILIPDADPWYSSKNGGKTRHGVGQISGLKMAKAFVSAGLFTRVMLLPENSDPNDLSKNRFPEKDFREELVKKALTPVQYQIWLEGHYLNLSETAGKETLLKRAKEIVEVAGGINAKDSFFAWLAEFVGVSISEVKDVFLHTFEKKAVMDYVRKCLLAGKTDEQIMAHIRKLIEQADATAATKDAEFTEQVDKASK